MKEKEYYILQINKMLSKFTGTEIKEIYNMVRQIQKGVIYDEPKTKNNRTY